MDWLWEESTSGMCGLCNNKPYKLFQFNAKSGANTDLLKVVSFTACTVKNFKPSQQWRQFNKKPHGLEGTSKQSQK